MSEKIMETLKTIHAKKMADVFSRIYAINQLENFTFINYSKIGNIIEEVTKRFVISEYNDGVKDRQIFIYLNDSDIDKNKVNCAVCIYHFTCDEDDKKDINVDDVTFLTYDKNDNISITVYDDDTVKYAMEMIACVTNMFHKNLGYFIPLEFMKKLPSICQNVEGYMGYAFTNNYANMTFQDVVFRINRDETLGKFLSDNHIFDCPFSDIENMSEEKNEEFSNEFTSFVKFTNDLINSDEISINDINANFIPESDSVKRTLIITTDNDADKVSYFIIYPF